MMPGSNDRPNTTTSKVTGIKPEQLLSETAVINPRVIGWMSRPPRASSPALPGRRAQYRRASDRSFAVRARIGTPLARLLWLCFAWHIRIPHLAFATSVWKLYCSRHQPDRVSMGVSEPCAAEWRFKMKPEGEVEYW